MGVQTFSISGHHCDAISMLGSMGASCAAAAAQTESDSPARKVSRRGLRDRSLIIVESRQTKGKRSLSAAPSEPGKELH
jgi:hypothetical protein